MGTTIADDVMSVHSKEVHKNIEHTKDGLAKGVYGGSATKNDAPKDDEKAPEPEPVDDEKAPEPAPKDDEPAPEPEPVDDEKAPEPEPEDDEPAPEPEPEDDEPAPKDDELASEDDAVN